MGGACRANGEKRSVYRLLVRNPKEKRLVTRPRRRWVCNIKVKLIEIGWSGFGGIDLAQDKENCRTR
jgi:hypothetical protein